MSDRTLSVLVKFAMLEKLTGPLRNIRSGTKATSQSIAETRKEIAALERSQAKIAGLKAMRKGLDETHDKLDATRRKIRALGEQMEAAEKPSKRLAQALEAARRQEERLMGVAGAQADRLRELQGELGDAGVDVRDLARHEERLADRIRATNDRLEEQRARLERVDRAKQRVEQAEETGDRLQSAGTTMMAAGAAIGAPLVASTISQAGFESQLTDIGQKANLARQQVAGMGVEFDRMGPDVAQLPTALAEAVDSLMGKGLNRKQAMEAIFPIGRAATAYKAEVLDLADATHASLDNLKVDASNTGKALDVMATAGKAGAFEIRDMAAYFPALTASANALGQRGVPAVADLAAALQITRKGAGDASTAANNLQNLMNKINTEDTIKNFKEFGIDIVKVLKKAAKEGKSPIEAIVEATNTATKGDLSKLAFLFGDAQVQAALRPLVQNIDLYRKIRAEALAAQGTVEADFNERMLDGAAKWEKLKARMQALGHQAGRVLLPIAIQLAEKMTALAERVSAWADRNPQLAATLVKIAAVVAVLLVVLGALAAAVGSVLLPFAMFKLGLVYGLPMLLSFGKALLFPLRILPLLGRAIWAFGALLSANPIILVIAAVVAVIAFAGYMIWKHWDKIKAAFWSGIAFLGQAWAKIKAFFTSGVGGVIASTLPMIGIPLLIFRHWGVISGWFARLWGRVKAIFAMSPGQIWQAFKTGFMAGLAWFHNLHVKFAQMGANLISGLIRGFVGKIGALKSTIEGVATSTGKWFAKKLGIHSPSRVFMGLGGFLTEGLAIGVDRGSAEPVRRMESVASRMAAAIAAGTAVPAMAAAGAGAMAPASSSAAAAGNTYHIHLPALPAGASAQDVAMLVRREIERLERDKAAAARSRYEDD